MEEFMKLVAQYQCKSSSVDLSSSNNDSDSDFYLPSPGLAKDAESCTGGKRKAAGTAARLPTRRPDPNVYNRNALLARENRRKKKAYMESVERELHETRSANRSLLKALKKQFKLTQKLEKECTYLKDTLGRTHYKERKKSVQISSPDNRDIQINRATSPEGSLISTYSSSSSYEPNPMETMLMSAEKNNGSVAEEQFINETPTSSWNDFIDDLLTDYHTSPAEYKNELEQLPLQPVDIIDEHSYFNKFAQIDWSPNYEWSSSRTPPTQLLQDEDFLIDAAGDEYLASL
ncbi:GH22775 [Drosophila grimshawi]|uniref:GH22775 n=1 Tax=Drosophila grimshawi TaxID=7222 RepID=B4JTI2_DROGR|nr:GH22775 [Drosophila grimshawi]